VNYFGTRIFRLDNPGRIDEIGLVFPTVDISRTGRDGVEYIIREIHEEDYVGVSEVYANAFPELRNTSYDGFTRAECYPDILQNRNTRILVADRSGIIPATSTIILNPQNMSAELALVVVSPEYQGTGLGSILFDESMTAIENAGTEYVCAFCETFDTKTQRLCEKHEFRRVGVMQGPILASLFGDPSRYYRAQTVYYEKLLGSADRLLQSQTAVLGPFYYLKKTLGRMLGNFQPTSYPRFWGI